MALKDYTFIDEAIEAIIPVIQEFVKKHDKELIGVGIGAILNSPAGRAVIKAAITKATPLLAKGAVWLSKAGYGLAKSAVVGAIEKIATKYGLKASAEMLADAKVASTITGGMAGDVTAATSAMTSKVASATGKVAAASAAGYILGSYLGTTIGGWDERSTKDNILRVMFGQFYATGDAINNIKDSISENVNDLKSWWKKVSEKKSISDVEKEKKFAKKIDQVQNHTPIGSNSDEIAYKAAKHKMAEPPTDPQGYNEWMKTLENKERLENMAKGRGSNDPQWSKDGKFNGIEYSGEYNFDLKNGDFERTPLPRYQSGTVDTAHGLPTVASLSLILTAGKAYNDMTEALFNDAVIKIKALNKNGSLTATWDKLDLFKLIHTMKVLYALWLEGCRNYKMVNEFQGTDLSTPYAYFAAMGYDWKTWQEARAQIQEDLQTLRSFMSVYTDFSNLNIFKKIKQLFSFGYMDGHSTKAQKTLFRLCGRTVYYNFATQAWTPISNYMIKDTPTISSSITGTTYAQWLSGVKQMMQSLVNVGKVEDMMACLRWVYKIDSNSAALFEVPKSSDRFSFVWNPEIMCQIENCIPTQVTSSINTYTMADNAAGTWFEEEFAYSSTNVEKICTKRFFNSHSGRVPKDEMIVGSRLQMAWLIKPGDTDPTAYYGTEVVVSYDIISRTAKSTDYAGLKVIQYYNNKNYALHSTGTTPAAISVPAYNLTEIGLCQVMDWCPMMDYNLTIGSTNTTAVSVTIKGIINADWENYTICFDTTVDASLVWMSFNRNSNYSFYSALQTDVDRIIEKIKHGA